MDAADAVLPHLAQELAYSGEPSFMNRPWAATTKSCPTFSSRLKEAGVSETVMHAPAAAVIRRAAKRSGFEFRVSSFGFKRSRA